MPAVATGQHARARMNIQIRVLDTSLETNNVVSRAKSSIEAYRRPWMCREREWNMFLGLDAVLAPAFLV